MELKMAMDKSEENTVSLSEPVAKQEWKDVTIKLSDEQISDLKKIGVDTDVIKIRTFDVANLADLVRN